MAINRQAFESELSRVFKLNGLASLLDKKKSELFYLLTERMLEENEKYNLTAITDPDKIIINHYEDCALLSAKLAKGAKIIDVGCGAGFPTLPLAIVREDISILAMDSTAKRINYVSETCEILGIANVTAVAMRAEDAAKMPEYREKSDTCGWVIATGATPDEAEQNAARAKARLESYILFEREGETKA